MARHRLEKDNLKYLSVNQFKHINKFIKPNECPIQTPNFDTLYSNAIVDITNSYVKLIIPKKIFNVYNLEKKYYSIQFIDISGNNIAFVSLRNNVQEYTTYYIIHNKNYDKAVKHIGYDPVNKILTDCWFLYLILRIQVDFTDEVDYTNSVLYQDSFRLEPVYLSPMGVHLYDYLKYPINQDIHVSNYNIKEFYNIFKHCYKYHTNFKYDVIYTDFNEYSYYLKFITLICRQIVKYLISRNYQGWICKKSFKTMKYYFNNDIFKTMISWKYLYAIDNKEAIYYMNRYDNDHNKLNGNNIYLIDFENINHFCNCFWSLSCYDDITAQFVKNWNDKYSIGNNIDKKVSIFLSYRKLEKEYLNLLKYKIENKNHIDDYTLFTPKDDYYLVLRIYYPKDNINDFILPKIIKVS